MTTIETCENCGKQIGKLETPMVHDGHVVCRKCKESLAESMRAEILNETDDLSYESRCRDAAYQRTKAISSQRVTIEKEENFAKALGTVVAILGTVGICWGYWLKEQGHHLGQGILGFSVTVAMVGLLIFAIGRWKDVA